MGEALHLGALVPAAVGACCTLGAPRSGRERAVGGLVAVVMLLAMLDAGTRMLGVPVLAWAALLVLTAVGSAFAGRVEARSPGHRGIMGLQGSLGSVVMAGLLVAMAAGSPRSDVLVTVGHHGGGASGTLTPVVAVVAVGALVYAAWSAVLARRFLRDTSAPRRAARMLPVIEVAGMGGSTALMLLTLAV